jgi:hypothetical protein
VKDGKDVINVPGKEYAEGTLAVTLYAEAVQIKEVTTSAAEFEIARPHFESSRRPPTHNRSGCLAEWLRRRT